MKRKIAAVLLATAMLSSSMAVFAEESTDAVQNQVDIKGPIVTTEGGDVLGYKLDGTYRFLGIPYATSERFGMPEKASWEGTLMGLTYGTVCPLEGQGEINYTEFITPSCLANQIENENCQNLNVWTQTLDSEAKKPVIVWIHGGGFSSGSSTELKFYEGANLSAAGDVVVVSLNHRLNSLGFLDLSAYGEEYKNSGNAGMADIVAALQWVHDNIEQFGGDPENVMIAGQSGGGAKVSTLTALPSAQGLFQKAVVQSGGVNGIAKEDAQAYAELVMKHAGCADVEELKAMDYRALVAATQAASAELQEQGKNYSWGPVVDGDFYPAKAVEDGTYTELGKDVTMMVATTLGEFSGNSVGLSKGFPGENYIPDLTEERVKELLDEKYGENAQAVADAFTAAYPNHPLADVLFTDSGFFAGANEIVEAKAKQAEEGGQPVYQYLFAYDFAAFGGVTPPHCAEIPFFLHNADTARHLTLDDPAAEMIEDQLSKAYINFAYNGTPSVDNVEWAAYTPEDPSIMVFDTELTEKGDEIMNLFGLMGGVPMW